MQAARYDKLRVGNGQTASIFAVPTTKGVATLACLADDKTCAAIASTVQITGGKAFPVGPSDDLREKIESSLSRLESSEKSAASALKRAGKRSSQVDATRRLASAYASAASALRKAAGQPGRHAAQPASSSPRCGATAAAYTKAVSAGNHKDRAGYKRRPAAGPPARARASRRAWTR